MNRVNQKSHPFDMNEYFSGERFVVGGRDFESEDEETSKLKGKEKELKRPSEIRDFRQLMRDITRK